MHTMYMPKAYTQNEVNQTLQTCTLHDVCIRTLLMSTISNALLIHPHTHMYIPHTQCTHTHTCTYMHMHTHAYAHTHTRTRTRAHAHAHARTHTHTHTHTHRQTLRHTETHTHTQTQRESSITCAFCYMVALRKAGLNNKKQRGESCLVSCFISIYFKRFGNGASWIS